MADNSSSSSSSSAGAASTSIRKAIDLIVAADYAVRTSSDFLVTQNEISSGIIRGDFVLFRFTVIASEGDSAAFVIDASDDLEVIVTNSFKAEKSEIMAYSDDADFISGDWSDFSRPGGKVSARVDFDSYNLSQDIGSLASKEYKIALVLTPSGTQKHVTLWAGDVTIRNDLYRKGQGGSPISINPAGASLDASSSSSSSQSESSTSSTSESSANTSSSSQSSSPSSTSESSG